MPSTKSDVRELFLPRTIFAEGPTSERNQQCEKNEVGLGRAHQPPQRRPMDITCQCVTIWRKDDKGDQPCGGETTWKNTGATRYGSVQHKTG